MTGTKCPELNAHEERLFTMDNVLSLKDSSAAVIQSKTRREMIEGSGRIFQLLGLPRSTGQIYGLLYLSTKPLSLDQMVELLGLSKSSASIGTRHLISWKAIRQVWVPGERRDYFEAEGDLRNLLRGSYADFIQPRLVSSQKRIALMMADLDASEREGSLSQEEHKFCSERLKNLAKVQKKVLSLSPFVEKIL